MFFVCISVSWHVLEQKMTISSAQLQALRENIKNEHDGYSAPNYRGVKRNGHTVYKCAAAGSEASCDNDDWGRG